MKKLLSLFLAILLFFAVFVLINLNENYKQSKMEIANQKNKINELEQKLSSSNVATQSKHPIEMDLQACIQKDSSHFGMMKCTENATVAWEKETEKNLNCLKEKLPQEDFLLIEESQKQWEEYRKTTYKAIDQLVFNQQGWMYQEIALGEKLELTKQRAQLLKSFCFYQEL